MIHDIFAPPNYFLDLHLECSEPANIKREREVTIITLSIGLVGLELNFPVLLFVLRLYSPVNPMGSCRAQSVYLTTHLLGRLSPLSG